MTMKEAIRKYLEEEIQKDETLKKKYNPDKIEQCGAYITGEAKKYLHSENGAIEDSIVYKWARDFFIEDIAEKNPVQKEQQKPGIMIQQKKESVQKPKGKKKTDDSQYQMEFCF